MFSYAFARTNPASCCVIVVGIPFVCLCYFLILRDNDRSMRYLLTGDEQKPIRPAFCVLGRLLAPVIIPLAFLRRFLVAKEDWHDSTCSFGPRRLYSELTAQCRCPLLHKSHGRLFNAHIDQ